MKASTLVLMMALAGVLESSAFAQSDPGPPTGGGINRSYDDGYVYVDSTGDPFGFTTYWGYQNSSQIVGNVLLFHSESSLNANTIQVITDSYDISGLVMPPAPYSGGASGTGVEIPDAPFSRSIEDISIPEPNSLIMLVIGALAMLAGARVGMLKSPPNS